jgi:predicted nucleotidyltransferase component of viral defense system
MFSDDYLMEQLVLKGGNAIDLVYKISDRASMDIDFSIKGEFTADELDLIENKIKRILTYTFMAEKLKVFDIKFVQRPEKLSEEASTFWGGYKIQFKVIEEELHEVHSKDIDTLRRHAKIVRQDRKQTFEIDISKFEYCKDKREEEFGGYVIFVYSPEMLVFEKVRAICQQMPDYKNIVPTLTPTPRPRDFFDIYILMKKFPIDIHSKENKNLLRKIFEIKRVPLSFLRRIHEGREFHRQGFDSLRDTVRPGAVLKAFDVYFDFVESIFGAVSF